MIIRRVILVLSIALSAAVYYLLYLFAPSIFLLRANAVPQAAPELFRVDLRDVPEPASPMPGLDQRGLASRPGSVEDLLKEETQDLPLADLPIPETLVPPPLAEVLNREHQLERSDTLVAGIEAELVSIPEEAARRNIEVARRFVEADDTRILAKDEMPSLTDPRIEIGVLAIPRIGGGTGGLGGGAGPAEESAGLPRETPVESDLAMIVPGGEPSSPAVPGLIDETVIGRETVREALRQANPYQSLDQMVRVETKRYIDPATRRGYFELRIIPREDARIPVLPRDVTFVLDASSSIMQRKLDLTVRGVRACLATLRPEDRFNIVVFRDTPKLFRETLVWADAATLADAGEFLNGLRSGGTTDVYGAMKPVLDVAPREGVPGIVVMVTDGRPTEGNLAGRELINALSEENRLGNTVYTFGGGNTVNRYLMDLLAYRNRGQSQVTLQIEDVDDDLSDFFGRLRDALLVNLEADYAIVDENVVFPRNLPDFYRNRVVTVYGEFDPASQKEVVLRIQGRALNEKKEVVLRADLSEAPEGTREIAQQWAFEKTYYLIGELTRRGDDPAIVAEMQRLSNEFGVQTSYSQP